MAYVEYAYYISEYLLGRSPTVPENEFLFWEKQARAEIDMFTFGRVAADQTLVIVPVKDCCCELAELLYQADQVAQQSAQSGGAGPLSSYSNDGQSGTFDLSQSVYTESGKRNKVWEIIFRYLAHTGLLYAGVWEV